MKVVCFDLDDTLCKEIDYLKSAYQEIASYAARQCEGSDVSIQVLESKTFEIMMEAYQSGKNAFEALNLFLGVEIPVSELLKMYREHVPQIILQEEVCTVLDTLKKRGVLMGIISDGREQTQWNKIRALGLTRWMADSCIIINSSPQDFKPNSIGYERFETVIRTITQDKPVSFIYVGDNLKKDFIYPNQHGWQTICLKNDGQNIHAQDFESTPIEALPNKVIEKMRELIV